MTGSIFTSVTNAKRRIVAPAPPPPPGTPSPRIPGRYVFAWYMMYLSDYNPNNGGAPIGDVATINAYKQDIADAQAHGIDGFIIFVYGAQFVFNNTMNMFTAAEQVAAADATKPKFLLFFSPQIEAQGDVNFNMNGVNWIYYFMSNIVKRPNYFYYNGKAVMCPFTGVLSQQQTDLVNLVFNPLLANFGVSVFYTPSIQDPSPILASGTTMTAWGQQWIGSINWWAGSEPSVDVNESNYFASINNANGKPTVLDLSGAAYYSMNNPYFYLYEEHYGGEGIDQNWNNAMTMSPAPAFVLMTVWNDLTESYFSPIDVTLPTIDNQYDEKKLLKTHAGYTEFNKYYIQWYTTGVRPVIAKDALFYFYRTSAQSLNRFAPNGSAVNFRPDPPPDAIFTVTRLTAPATLRVTTGGQVNDYPLTPGATGLNFTRTNFLVGSQQFSLIRNGVTIASVSGENVVGSVPFTNLVSTSGFAYSA